MTRLRSPGLIPKTGAHFVQAGCLSLNHLRCSCQQEVCEQPHLHACKRACLCLCPLIITYKQHSLSAAFR